MTDGPAFPAYTAPLNYPVPGGSIDETSSNLDQQIAAFKTASLHAAIEGYTREDFLHTYATLIRGWQPYELAQLLTIAIERLVLTPADKP